jgi:hypothetical protein
VISPSEWRRNRGGSPYGVVRQRCCSRPVEGLAQVVGVASSSDGCQPREQLVMCVAPAYRVEAGCLLPNCCQE